MTLKAHSQREIFFIRRMLEGEMKRQASGNNLGAYIPAALKNFETSRFFEKGSVYCGGFF